MSDGLPPALDAGPGPMLADPDWLRDRIAETGRFYRTQDLGVAATLWWYSSSTVLLGPSLHALAALGHGTRLEPAALRLTLTPYGTLARVWSGDQSVEGGAEGLGWHLDAALNAVIAPLAEVAGVGEQRLWALAADALAGRLLNERRPDLADPVAATCPRLRPAPRYVTVTLEAARPGRTQQFVRRGSCCLIFRVPGGSLCVSCPRQLPSKRQERLQTQVRYSGRLPD